MILIYIHTFFSIRSILDYIKHFENDNNFRVFMFKNECSFLFHLSYLNISDKVSPTAGYLSVLHLFLNLNAIIYSENIRWFLESTFMNSRKNKFLKNL